MKRKANSIKTWTPSELEQRSYEAGKDYAINGANTSNCNFSLFTAPELKDAWERGRDEILETKK